MRRALCSLLAAGVISAFAAATFAQESTLWLDWRDNHLTANTGSDYNAITQAAAMNGPFGQDAQGAAGRRGGGQFMLLNPRQNNNYHLSNATSFPNLDGDGNRATGNLWLYMDVADDLGGTDDVISSVGVDFDVVPPAGTIRNRIQSLDYIMYNDGSVSDSTIPIGTGTGPWNGVNNGAISGASPAPDWNGAKAVAVPVTTGPTYNSTGRLVPRDASVVTNKPYRLGRLKVTADLRVCTGATIPPFDSAGGNPINTFNNRSTYNVFLKVNNLLITRVFATGASANAQEDVSFGYSGASPELPTVSGSTVGIASVIPDAVIQVRMKGDVDGNGIINSQDTTPFLNNLVTPTSDNPTEAYLGDYTPPPGSAVLANGLVNSQDTNPFLASFVNNTPCP